MESVSPKKKLCECGCGTEVRIETNRYVHGHNVAECGFKKTHGMRQSPEYSVWCGMLRRCYREKEVSYPSYGGRGIRVCDRWRHSFENFYADMGPRPPKFSIERRDISKDYAPDNCYWLPRRLQNRNRSINTFLAIDGRTQCVGAWAEEQGLDRNMVYKRLKRGMSARDAVFTPNQRRKKP